MPPPYPSLPLTLTLTLPLPLPQGLSALRALCEVVAPFQRPLCERTFVGFDKCVYGAAADEHALYLAHGGGPVVKIRTDDWKESGRFEGHADDVNCVALHGELLLSGSDDYSIKLWRTALGPAGESGCIASLTGHEARVWCVVATDEHIYSCGADKVRLRGRGRGRGRGRVRVRAAPSRAAVVAGTRPRRSRR